MNLFKTFVSLSIITLHLLLIGCKSDHNWKECTACDEMDGINYYFNNINGAISCAKKMNKPILVHFTDWSKSHWTFYDKLIKDRLIRQALMSDFVLLVLTCDDRKKISLSEYSTVLNSSKNSDIETLGQANEAFKKYLGIAGWGKANPNYIVISSELKPLSKSWGYTSNPDNFLYQLRKLSKKP